MPHEKLKVVLSEKKPPCSSGIPIRNNRRTEIQKEMETFWQQDPEQFDPQRDSMQKLRTVTASQLIQETMDLKDKRVADLGCGFGALSRKCRDAGAYVDAVDIAPEALKRLKEDGLERISPIQECMPTTRLKDEWYDLVLCTDMIGYLKPNEYRMAIAELSRIVKKEGLVFCSTPIDLNSDDALERFIALFETEFSIKKTAFTYDKLLLRICHILEWPYRKSKNSKFFLWKFSAFLLNPAVKYFRQSDSIRIFCEKWTRFFRQQSGISHVLLVGQRRPLSYPLPKQEIPQEPKHKREVWE